MEDFSEANWVHIPAIDYKGPVLSVEQMREVDRLMMEKYYISLLQMMENAGRSLAALAMNTLSGMDKNAGIARVTVFAGIGGNGGGAMAAARRLHNWGRDVEVVLAGGEENMGVEVQQQLKTLRLLEIPVFDGKTYLQSKRSMGSVVIDGLIGYSLKGAPRGLAGEMIDRINRGSPFVLSLDVPSGLQPVTGEAFKLAVKADATLTLALPKTGLCSPDAWPYTGEIYLADISVPPELYLEPELGFKVPDLFSRGDIILLRHPS